VVKSTASVGFHLYTIGKFLREPVFPDSGKARIAEKLQESAVSQPKRPDFSEFRVSGPA
jgi:hypothetical protein